MHRYFEANDTAYIVMEYVDGESLAAVLEKHGTLTPAQWWPWMKALLDGLEHVHRRDYLHRDVKPANIVIRANSAGKTNPVLVDFGAARRAAAEKTRHLTAVHTPGYAPIEQYSASSRQGPATDIYALAAVTYRVLAGEPPPDAADRIVEDAYLPLAKRLRRPGDRFLAAIDRALAPRAADRPQSVAVWRVELTGAASEDSTSSVAYNSESPAPPDIEWKPNIDDAQWAPAWVSDGESREPSDIESALEEDAQEDEWNEFMEEVLEAGDGAPEGMGPGEDEDGRW